MAKTKAQIQFEADTSQFTAGIKQADKSLATMRNELKLNSAELKENGDSVELLADRQNILQREQSESANKIGALENKLAMAKQTFGENSQEVYNLTNQLLKAKTQFQGIQNDISDTDKRMERLSDSAEDVGTNVADSSDGFTIMKGAMADLVADGISFLVSGIGDLIGSLFDLAEATEEYRVMQGKLEGSADTFGYKMGYVKDKYAEFYGYLGDDQMATNAITNLMGLGVETDTLNQLASASVGVWSAYGDSIPIEGLTESMNETAQVGKVTGSLADALNWAGISEDEFNKKLEKTKTTQERATLIADTLNGKYGESKQKYDELNGSITEANRAELELKDTQAKLGEAISPVTTAFSDLKNNALQAILPIVEKLAKGFLDMLSWLKEHPTTLKIVTGVVIALATAFGVLAGALAIQGLIAGVTKAIAFLNTTLLANPIVLIIALIAGLVAGFLYLWNNCDAFRNFWKNLWANIKAVFNTAVEGVKSGINKIKNFFSELWSKIKSVFGNIKTSVSTTWNNVLSTITGVVSNVKSAVSNTFNSVRTSVSNIFNGIKSTASSVWNGIKNAIMNPVDTAKNAVKSAIDKIKGFFNFSWSLPKLKLPHISIKGKFSLAPPKVPKFSISWHKDGGIMTEPTLFGFNPATNTAHIGGEAGAEAILPLDRLETWINSTLRQSNMEIAQYNNTRMEKLISVAEKILAKDSNTYIDGNKVSRAIGGSSDRVNGERLNLKGRGLVL